MRFNLTGLTFFLLSGIAFDAGYCCFFRPWAGNPDIGIRGMNTSPQGSRSDNACSYGVRLR